MVRFTESTVEEAALSWLEATGWQATHGPKTVLGMPTAERANYAEVVPPRRLRDALARPNPGLPAEALENALLKLAPPDLLSGQAGWAGGAIRGAQARVIDFEDPANASGITSGAKRLQVHAVVSRRLA